MQQLTTPLSLAESFRILRTRIIRKKSSKAVRKARKILTVTPTPSKYFWDVEGGQCKHTVWLSKPIEGMGPPNQTLVCLNHSPSHKEPKPGYACSHISAVQLMLANQLIMQPKELTAKCGCPRVQITETEFRDYHVFHCTQRGYTYDTIR